MSLPVFDIIKVSLVASMFSFLGEPDMIFSWYRKAIMRLPDWLNRPLGSCHLCLTGQACFWWYIIFCDGYSLADHLFLTSLGIFLSSLYYYLWNLGQ